MPNVEVFCWSGFTRVLLYAYKLIVIIDIVAFDCSLLHVVSKRLPQFYSLSYTVPVRSGLDFSTKFIMHITCSDCIGLIMFSACHATGYVSTTRVYGLCLGLGHTNQYHLQMQ